MRSPILNCNKKPPSFLFLHYLLLSMYILKRVYTKRGVMRQNKRQQSALEPIIIKKFVQTECGTTIPLKQAVSRVALVESGVDKVLRCILCTNAFIVYYVYTVYSITVLITVYVQYMTAVLNNYLCHKLKSDFFTLSY